MVQSINETLSSKQFQLCQFSSRSESTSYGSDGVNTTLPTLSSLVDLKELIQGSFMFFLHTTNRMELGKSTVDSGHHHKVYARYHQRIAQLCHVYE